MHANCLPHHNKNLVEVCDTQSTFRYNAKNPHPSVKNELCAFCGVKKDNKRAAFCSLLCQEYAEIKADFKNLWFNPEVNLNDFPDEPTRKF